MPPPRRRTIHVLLVSVIAVGALLTLRRVKPIAPVASDRPLSQHTQLPFNYTAFWESAWEKARASAQAEQKGAPSPCPKVYVYDLTMSHPSLTDNPSAVVANASVVDKIFGPVTFGWEKGHEAYRGYLRNTNESALASILEYRLRSSSQCRTSDPRQADLFFVPVVTLPKRRGHWKMACRAITGEMLQASLPYLNATNGCRHFMAVGGEHYVAKNCTGWFSFPLTGLQPLQRLAYSHFGSAKNKWEGGTRDYRTPLNETSAKYPHLVSVPFPSSFHYFQSPVDEPRLPQWTSNRTLLVSYIGTDTHGDTEVRKRIVQQCQTYHKEDAQICQHLDPPSKELYKTRKDDYLMIKSKAVFCLEPAGDSPWRKSIADSVAFGCIPVFFSNLTDDWSPWHWGDWKARARVLVSRSDFLTGRIDLKTLLQSIPPHLLELMQTALEQNMRKFQYSTFDDPQDGVRLILHGLHQKALYMEQRGYCTVSEERERLLFKERARWHPRWVHRTTDRAAETVSLRSMELHADT